MCAAMDALSRAARARVAGLRASRAAGDWWLMPPAPDGHCFVEDHDPFGFAVPAIGLMLVFAVSRRVLGGIAVAAGRAVRGQGANQVDWSRFRDVSYFTVCHLALCALFVGAVGSEALGWLTDTGLLWAYEQPRLSAGMRAYYVIELAFTGESCIQMLLLLAADHSSRDVPMLIHHAATLLVMLAALRAGFVRVGAAVLFIHDATDLPIDAIRLCQSLCLTRSLYASVLATLASWAALRLYAFPRYIVASALLDTTHYFEVFDFLGVKVVWVGYVLYVLPLTCLVLLHYFWYGLIVLKAGRQLGLLPAVENKRKAA
mmetsp:Transcript_561/g.1227  ORF Transcript_561/g.1227 Transcript_561/m.1227 type:complete len:316 (-) Transcript_561:178-1125(-)